MTKYGPEKNKAGQYDQMSHTHRVHHHTVLFAECATHPVYHKQNRSCREKLSSSDTTTDCIFMPMYAGAEAGLHRQSSHWYGVTALQLHTLDVPSLPKTSVIT